MTSRQRGFTIVEVMVALTLGAMVVLLAHALFGLVATTSNQLRSSDQQQDREWSSRVWLTDTFLSVEVGGSEGNFIGSPDSLQFAAWTQQPGGWLGVERITVRLRGTSIIASGHLSGDHGVAENVVGLACDYLSERGQQAHWVQSWASPVIAPQALRLRVSRNVQGTVSTDTTVFLVGERG